MNQYDLDSVLIEASFLMDLILDEVYQEHDKKFDVMDAQCAVSELVQRARFLHRGNATKAPPLSSDTLELIARLAADYAIDNAQYMAKGEGK